MSHTDSRIAMVLFSYYPDDPRPRREAEALTSAGIPVDMICLQNIDQGRSETVQGVNVYRLPVKRKRAGKLRYLWQYCWFTLLAAAFLIVRHTRRPYNIIHVHNMPDFLVFSALFPRWMGARVILDLHDPMPEVYMAKYALDDSHPAIRLLRYIEKVCINFADLVITPNLSFKNLFISRGCPADKLRIVMNSPDEAIFQSGQSPPAARALSDKDELVLMYHGTIVERNGLDTALQAICDLRSKIPGIRFDVYGEGDYAERFLELVDQLDLAQHVRYHGFVPLEQIVRAIEGIDLGIIPNQKTPFTEINLPTRIFEYLCLDRHVIAPQTKGIRDYFDEDSLIFFDPGDWQSLSEAVYDLYRNPDRYQHILKNGKDIYRRNRWDLQRKYLLECVRSLDGGNGPTDEDEAPRTRHY